ncbi:MAG: hypothetical protein LBL66_03300 [Clostridiales bacterium]|nr:hypothetical protein [Clostridiales bacterium]
MKRKLPKIALSLILAVALLSPAWAAAKPAKAATVDETPVLETFDGDGTGAAWALGGDAELLYEGSALRFASPNAWQPIVKATAYKADRTNPAVAGYTLEFDARYMGGSGWLGIAVGIEASTGHFFEAGTMFMLSHDGGGSVWRGSGTDFKSDPALNEGFTLSNHFQAGATVTYKIAATRLTPDENNGGRLYRLEFWSRLAGGEWALRQSLESATAHNHFGFCSMSGRDFVLDITRVDYRVYGGGADNDDTIQELNEDFTSAGSRLNYPGEATDYTWTLSAVADGVKGGNPYAPKEAFFMGPMKSLSFENSTDGRLVSTEPFAPDTRVGEPLEISFTIKAAALGAGAYFGLATGLPDAAAAPDSANLLYIKNAGGVRAGVLKNGAESQNAAFDLALGAETALRYAFKYRAGLYDAAVYIGAAAAPALTLTGLRIDGYIALATKGGNGASVSLTADDLALSARNYADPAAYAEMGGSETIDFLGKQEREVNGAVYQQNYYNRRKWFVNGAVNMPAPALDNTAGRVEFTGLGSGTTTAPLNLFGPTRAYGDFIVRARLQVTDAASGYIGIALGRPQAESPAAGYPMIRFANGGGATVISGQNMTGAPATVSETLFDPSKAFDITVIVSNGTAGVYYAEAGAENPSYALRAAFTGVKSYGYTAVTGEGGDAEDKGGARFRVLTYSVTELNDSYTVVDETETAANVSEIELNDYAAIGFSNGFINATRWKLTGAGMSAENGALAFAGTNKNASLSTVGRFRNFQANFDVTPGASDITLGFGRSEADPTGRAITFKAGGAGVSLAGMENGAGKINFDLPADIYAGGAVNVKLTVIGGVVRLYLKSAAAPMTEFETPAAALSLTGAPYAGGSVYLATGANGDMRVGNIRVVSLNYTVDIVTEHYEGSNKPPLTDLTAPSGNPVLKGCKKAAAAGISAGAAALAALLLKRKRAA